ncbi:MAG TPA: hypothetical protein VIQ31_07515 [Phormidium sp.]
MEIAIAAEEMATTVLLIGEWLLKQQQQLKQQQRKLEEKQQLIEEQQQEIEQLKEALDIAFLRKMRYDVTDLNEVKNIEPENVLQL